MKIYSCLVFSASMVLLVACGGTDNSTIVNTAGIKKLGPDSANFITQKVSVQKDGKIVLSPADFNGSSSGISGYDAGMNAVKNGDITNNAWSAVKGYNSADDKYSVYLRDPSVAGFSYQTFGQVINNDNRQSEGYVSIGNVYVPNAGEKIDATYKGIAMGTYDNASEVIADMMAKVSLDGSTGSMNIATTNSYIAQNNATEHRYSGISADDSFDFTDQLTWNKDEHLFKSDTAKAYLYGAKATEIGGTFERTKDGKSFVGGFGAVKQ